MLPVLRLAYLLAVFLELAPQSALGLGRDLLDEALDDVVAELVLGQSDQAEIYSGLLVGGVKGQCQFLPILGGGQLDDPFDDVAGVLVAGKGDEVVEENLLDQRLVLLRVGNDVLHHVVPVLALR